MYRRAPTCQIKNLPEILETHLGYKDDGRFIDVGAWNGYQWSNTFCLAEIGWKGICFEPYPQMFRACKQLHAGRDVIVQKMAISDYTGEGTLHLGGSISTLLESQVEIYGRTKGFDFVQYDQRVVVKVDTLDNQLAKFGWLPGIDFVSIDVEGAEMEVLKGFDLDHWRPRLLAIETHEMHPSRDLNWKGRVIGTALDFYGYQAVQADTINTIYVRK